MSALTPPQHLPGGMLAWVCEYTRPDGIYGCILHGTNPAQIIADNGDRLPDLRVLGVHGGTVRAEE